MHDVRWERWLGDLAREYFVAAFRPELPAAERLRAAARAREFLARLEDGGPAALAWLVHELSSSDTQRRNAAARAVSELGDAAAIQELVRGYLQPGRPWLAPAHLVRAARRHPLDPDLIQRLGDLPLRLQPALVQALLVADTPRARVLLDRLLVGPDAPLAEAAGEAVSAWGKPNQLWKAPRRVDGTDVHPPALVPAAIAACLHLAASGDARALDWLEERTLDDDPVLAGLALSALGALGWPGCLAELADHLEQARGAALGFGLEAADLLGSAGAVPFLCDVIRRTAEQSGPGLDDNPADQAIRVLERLTGRWVPADLCSYDRHGSYDASTRRRAALLYASVGAELDPACCYREGEPMTEAHLVQDLLSASPRRARAAVLQLRSRTGRSSGFDPRADLLDNLDAVQAWQSCCAQGGQGGRYRWQLRDVTSPMIRA